MLNCKIWQNPDNQIVHNCPVVQLPLNFCHQNILYPVNGHCIVFESERFVFVVDQTLPKPYEAAYLLPEGNFVPVVMIIIMV